MSINPELFLTVEDLDLMPDDGNRYELISGDLYVSKTPGLTTVGAAVQADRIRGAPDLAIEILSPGAENARRDRVAKRYLYAKFGVKEYWVVDPLVRQIEIYRLDGATLMMSATLGENEEITSPLLPGYKCRVGDFFV
jgi:Uma2 family endonuclease